MTNEIRSPNVENSQLCGRRFRHSDLRIAVCSIKRPLSGLVRAAGGGAVHGGRIRGAVLCILPSPPSGLFHSRPCLVFLVKPRVTAFEADFLPANPHPFHAAPNVQNVSIGG